ncbi:hypothetical protein QE429_000694 [Bacillus sp. SORGH_AS 510]|uniref:hypothetical protein n=1 Tax=Bacillus sp. SORGH_AS_0510 TaxID=3041771 RepID=UPI00277E2E5F|nr:hypothetical protein [Bacillus sp. SORGH_AS_0510]MDQ1143867.1 hypothetical protein [Bacillus sp. SORGH_AS_0510]
MANYIQIIRLNVTRHIRSSSFLLVIALSIFFSYLCVPSAKAGYEVFYIGGVRGIYNSAWLGGMVAMLSVLLLWLFGFFMLRNKFSEDKQIKVTHLIHTTQFKKLKYLFSHFVANFFVLNIIAITLIISFIIMQEVRGEDRFIHLADYIVPYLLVVLPSISFLSSLTILFDVVAFLKGTFGNIMYFFIWILLSVITVSNPNHLWDFFGMHLIMNDMATVAASKYHFIEVSKAGSFGYYPIEAAIQTFNWPGITIEENIVITRVIWIILSLIIIFASSSIFRPFSKSRKTIVPNEPIKENIPQTKLFDKSVVLTPLSSKRRGQLFKLIKAELLIMLKGFSAWWYLILIAGALVPILTSFELTKIWLPLLMILPLPIWSQMETREKEYSIDAFIKSSCSQLTKWFSVWIAAFIVSSIISSGALITFMRFGQIKLLIYWIIGLAFMCSLGLTLGNFSKTRRLFEIIYLILWYLGPINSIPYFDFLGLSNGYPLFYLGCSIVLLILLFIRNKRSII